MNILAPSPMDQDNPPDYTNRRELYQYLLDTPDDKLDDKFLLDLLDFHGELQNYHDDSMCHKQETVQNNRHYLYHAILGRRTNNLLVKVCRLKRQLIKERGLDTIFNKDQFYYRECFLSGALDRKHFIRDMLYDDRAFNSMPICFKLISLMFRLYNGRLELENDYLHLEELIKQTIEYHDLQNDNSIGEKNTSKAICTHIISTLQSMMEFSDWCSDRMIDEHSSRLEKKISIVRKLLTGSSKLEVLQNTCLLNSLSNNSMIDSDICKLLEPDQRELMTYKAYIVIKTAIIWLIGSETKNTEYNIASAKSRDSVSQVNTSTYGHYDHSATSHFSNIDATSSNKTDLIGMMNTSDVPQILIKYINEIHPASLRLEVLENLFSLLFLTEENLVNNSNITKNYTPPVTNDEVFMMFSYEDRDHRRMETRTYENDCQFDSQKYQKSSNLVRFLCPNEIISSLLSLIKSAILNLETEQFNSRKNQIGSQELLREFGDHYNSSSLFMHQAPIQELNQVYSSSLPASDRISSGRKGEDENLNQRLANLNQFVSAAQWRYSLIEPTFKYTTDEKCDSNKDSSNESLELKSSEAKTRASSHSTINDESNFHSSVDTVIIDSPVDNSDCATIFIENELKATRRSYLLQADSTSIIPSMLAPPKKLLTYCLIKDQISRARQVLKLFEVELTDTNEAKELILIEKTNELHENITKLISCHLKSTKNMVNSTDNLEDSPSHSNPRKRHHKLSHDSSSISKVYSDDILKAIQNFSQHPELVNFDKASITLLDYSITTCPHAEISRYIGEHVLFEKKFNGSNGLDPIVQKLVNKFLDIMDLLVDASSGDPKTKDNFLNYRLSKTLAFNYDMDLSPRIDNNERNLDTHSSHLSSNIVEYINDFDNQLQTLLPIDSDDIHRASSDLQKKLMSNYQKISLHFQGLGEGKLNYLASLLSYVKKVGETLEECRKRSPSFNRQFPVTQYFAVLNHSPSAILCAMVLKDGMSPEEINGLARELQIDLVGTLCSVVCPNLPSSYNPKLDENHLLIEAMAPALCDLAARHLKSGYIRSSNLNYSTSSSQSRVSLEDLSDIVDHQRGKSWSPGLIQFFRSHSKIVTELLCIIGVINMPDSQIDAIHTDARIDGIFSDQNSTHSQAFGPKSPLIKYIDLVKSKICSSGIVDQSSLVTACLHPRLSCQLNVFMKILEHYAVEKNFIRMHKILKLLPTVQSSPSYRTLRRAILSDLAKETNDPKYILQMEEFELKAQFLLDMIENSESFNDYKHVLRSVQSCLRSFTSYPSVTSKNSQISQKSLKQQKQTSQFDELSHRSMISGQTSTLKDFKMDSRRDNDVDLTKQSLVRNEHLTYLKKRLEDSLVEVRLYDELAKLTGLRTWREAKNSLSVADMMAVFKARKQYKSAKNWVDLKGFETDYQELQEELVLLSFCEDDALDEAISFLDTIVSTPYACVGLVNRVLPRVDSLKVKGSLAQYIIDRCEKILSIEEISYYKDCITGIKLIQLLPHDLISSYMHLLTKPKLIIEQMLMNIEYESLKEGVKIAKYDHLIEEYCRKAVDIQICDLPPANLSHSLNQQHSFQQSNTSQGTTSQVNVTNVNIDAVSETTVISSIEPNNSTRTGISSTVEQEFIMPSNVPDKSEWVPDWKVTYCMVCKIEKFSLLNRRHHCRRCGRVVCSNCSNKFLLVREISNRSAVRVCCDCYSQTKIIEASTSASSPTSSNFQYSRPFMWLLNANDVDGDLASNEEIRKEFYYDTAPSVSLCLSILRLHSDQSRGCKFLIDSVCQPLFETLTSNQTDSGLIINMIKSLLTSAKINLGDKRSEAKNILDRMLSQVDVIRTLVNNNCCDKFILSIAFSPDHSPVRLQEKLLEMERFDLALEIAMKFGLDVPAVWRTWAMQCLKNRRFPEAREKFKHCFTRTRQANDQINQTQSKLLSEILSAIVKLEDKQRSLAARIYSIEHGQFSDSNLPKDLSLPSAKPAIFAEALYYLDLYGSLEDYVRFFVSNGLWRRTIELLAAEPSSTANEAYNKLFFEDVFMKAAAKGSLNELLSEMSTVDPTQNRLWKYKLAVCKYCARKQMHNLLYYMQENMNDHLRAAITQINCFFLKKPIINYRDLNGRLHHLVKARRHCEQYLSDANQAAANRVRMMNMSENDVTRQIKVISTQIDVTQSFSANNVIGCLNGIELEDSTTDDPSQATDSLDHPVTLFDKALSRRTLFAALVACYYGNYPSEGLTLANQLIDDNELDRMKVLRTAARIFVLCEGSELVQRVEQFIQCIESEIKLNLNKYDTPPTKASIDKKSEMIRDDIVSAAIRSCKEPDYVMALIKLISSQETKMNFYIELGQLSNAQLLAIKLNRPDLVRKILDEAIRIDLKHVINCCAAWLDTQAMNLI